MHSIADPTIIPPVVIERPVIYSQTNAAKMVITREEMAQIGLTSLTQTLQTLGGLQLLDTSGNGSQIIVSMRGFGANASSNTLLLVNGIPITNPDLAPPDINSIPFQEIKSIEIISGSESVLYGDQAVGGVINIITQEKSKDNLAASCMAGSYNAHNCSASVNKTFNQIQFGLNGLTQHTDNYRDHNDYDQNLLSGYISSDYSSGTIKLNYTFANERLLYPGALTAAEVEENRRQSTNDTDFFTDSNASVHIRQDQTLSSHWHLITDVQRRQMMGSGVLFSPFRQSRIINFIKPQLKGAIGNVLLSGGLDYENDTYDLNTDFGVTDDSEQKMGVFSMATLPLTKNLALIAGARGAQMNSQLNDASEINTINRALATSVGFSYQFQPDVRFYLRRAGSFRFPKADENASTPPGVNGLKTQQGVAYEAGTEWKWHEANTRASVYQLNLNDEIAFDPQQTVDRPFGTNTNYPPTIRRGLNLSEKYSITYQVSLDGQYNYVNARFQSGIDSGNKIPLVSENIFHGGVDYAFLPHWNLYSEAVFTGSQYSANDNANAAGLMGGYTTYNMNVRFLYQSFTASLRFNNIFNKYYYLYTTYEPSIDEQFFYPAPGRNILLTLKYLFE